MLAIFHGPHGYVSPSWYEAPRNVPTWNYVTVHAYGRARLLDPSELGVQLSDLVERHERDAVTPWRLESLPEGYAEKLMRAIVGFEIAVERVEGTLKLSQNRSSEDQRRVLDQMSSSVDPTTREVARWMARLDERRRGRGRRKALIWSHSFRARPRLSAPFRTTE